MVLFGVQVGNFLYFIFLAILVGCAILSIYLARHKDKDTLRRICLIILWCNFGLHFVKQLIPYYISEWPSSLARSTPENLCAVLIMASPFIYIWGNKYLKDYMFYIGIISGILAYVVPTGPTRAGFDTFSGVLETLRYYACHAPLVMVPLIMVESGDFKLDYHRLWAVPLFFTLAQVIIVVDEVILYAAGVSFNVPANNWAEFFTNKYDNNQAMSFGPLKAIEPKFEWLYKIFIPGLQIFYYNGQRYFTPAVWLLPLMYVGTALLGPLFALRWEKNHMKEDFLSLKTKMKAKKANQNE